MTPHKKKMTFVLRSFVLPPIEQEEKKKTKCFNNCTDCPKSNHIMFDSRVCRGSTLKPESVLRQQHSLKLLERKRDKKRQSRKKNIDPVKGRVHVSVQTDETLCDILKDNFCDVYDFEDETIVADNEVDFVKYRQQENECALNSETVNSNDNVNKCESSNGIHSNVSYIAHTLVDIIQEQAVSAYIEKKVG